MGFQSEMNPKIFWEGICNFCGRAEYGLRKCEDARKECEVVVYPRGKFRSICHLVRNVLDGFDALWQAAWTRCTLKQSVHIVRCIEVYTGRAG